MATPSVQYFVHPRIGTTFEGTGIITHCFHPGVVRTRFGPGAWYCVAVLAYLPVLMISAKRGARTGLHLAQ